MACGVVPLRLHGVAFVLEGIEFSIHGFRLEKALERYGMFPLPPVGKQVVEGRIDYGLCPYFVPTKILLPPRMEERSPLAVLPIPPLTEATMPLAMLLSPPLMEDQGA